MSLDNLALIGNGTIGALIDGNAHITWCCFPRFDGDPVFCSLVRSEREGKADFGHFSIDVVDKAKTEQEYMLNTAVLCTRVYDATGGCIEITDFAPRYRQYGRIFAPMMLVRQIRRVYGNPRMRIRLRPAQGYGREPMTMKRGSNHITYIGEQVSLRLTSNAGMTAILEEGAFFLDHPVTLIFGPETRCV